MRVREVAYFHEIKGIAMQKTDFNVLAFCSLSMLELQCTESLV